jgi:hypothetical protein
LGILKRDIGSLRGGFFEALSMNGLKGAQLQVVGKLED